MVTGKAAETDPHRWKEKKTYNVDFGDVGKNTLLKLLQFNIEKMLYIQFQKRRNLENINLDDFVRLPAVLSIDKNDAGLDGHEAERAEVL